MDKKTPIIIVSQRQKTGGSIVLHLLCKILLDKGYNAKIFILPYIHLHKMCTFKFWLYYIKGIVRDTIKLIICKIFEKSSIVYNGRYKGYSYIPVKNVKRKFLPHVSKDAIVVYPEVVYGNRLKARNVVRWLLYYPPFPNDENAYGEKDLFFVYRAIFNDDKLNSKCRVLKLNYFDYNLYKQTNFGERSGKCYMLRKGETRDDLPLNLKHEEFILDHLSESQIVESFNKYKYCYFYDCQTFYSIIAAICGCIPIIVCEKNKFRKDYLGPNEYGYGIAYDDTEEEINFAINTRYKLIDHINSFREKNDINVKNFITECENYFRL